MQRPNLAGDPFAGRAPTSHERTNGVPWDASYHDGPAPWDVGGPQPAVVRVASRGGFTGDVLDAGCGSGENALHLASLGLPVVGFDVAETALGIARKNAEERGLAAEFVSADAFDLAKLGRTFATVLDCGLYHTFEDEERLRYVASIANATRHGGTLYVLCFADGPGAGPHPVLEGELRTSFTPSTGWTVASIERERVRTRYHDEYGAPAWFATILRT